MVFLSGLLAVLFMGFAVWVDGSVFDDAIFHGNKGFFVHYWKSKLNPFCYGTLLLVTFSTNPAGCLFAQAVFCRRLQNLNIKEPLKNPRNPNPRAGSSAGMNA
jgi:hypothetical protein